MCVVHASVHIHFKLLLQYARYCMHNPHIGHIFCGLLKIRFLRQSVATIMSSIVMDGFLNMQRRNRVK